MYRTGKSYLLNKVLLNRNKGGFAVGPSINSITKGLLIWPELLEVENSKGEKLNVLLIDTEGIGAM